MSPWRALFCAGWFAGVITSAVVRRWTAAAPPPRPVPPPAPPAREPSTGRMVVRPMDVQMPEVGVPLGGATAAALHRRGV